MTIPQERAVGGPCDRPMSGRLQGSEHFRVCFSAKVDQAAGTFSGYASVFGSLVEAHMPSIVEPGAFTKTLKENGRRVKILWQHRTDEPLGVPEMLREDARGLFVKARISRTRLGLEALQLLQDGVVREMSIGFDPITWEMRSGVGSEEPIRVLKEVKLWEVSLVSFAADPLATVDEVRPATDLVMAELNRKEKQLIASQVCAMERKWAEMTKRDTRRQVIEAELRFAEAQLGRGR